MTEEDILEQIARKATRMCNRCSIVRPVTQYFIVRDKNPNQWRFNSPCKVCYKDKSRDEKRKAYQRDRALINKYGIDSRTYYALLSSQDQKCAICRTPFDPQRKHFAVDHCHASGKIRGILCEPCNLGLGYFRDNTDRLGAAIRYLATTSASPSAGT